MKTFLLLFCFAVNAALASPVANAATPVGEATFTGIVDHISTTNIKVTDPKHNETVSFLLVPRFNKIFSSDGKTTYQMAAIKPGQYVKVYYDQKALGTRHADRIILLTQENEVKKKISG